MRRCSSARGCADALPLALADTAGGVTKRTLPGPEPGSHPRGRLTSGEGELSIRGRRTSVLRVVRGARRVVPIAARGGRELAGSPARG